MAYGEGSLSPRAALVYGSALLDANRAMDRLAWVGSL